MAMRVSKNGNDRRFQSSQGVGSDLMKRIGTLKFALNSTGNNSKRNPDDEG